MDNEDRITYQIMPEAAPIGIVWMDRQGDAGTHSHKFMELVVVFRGHAYHRYGGQRYVITAGDIFLIRPGVEHAYEETDDLELVNLLYYPEKLNLPDLDLLRLPGYHAVFDFEPLLREQNGFGGHLRVRGSDLEVLRPLCKTLAHELHEKRAGYVYASAAVLMQILVVVSRLYQKEEADEQQGGLLRLGEVLGTIQSRFREQIKIPELAKKAGMSHSGLYRLFRTTFGESPKEYLLKLRLEYARGELEKNKKSMAEIALESGFMDSNYFSRAFRRAYHLSPREYRKKYEF